jgi:hypothetical protein
MEERLRAVVELCTVKNSIVTPPAMALGIVRESEPTAVG